MPVSTFHATTREGARGVILVSALSLPLRRQTETMPYSSCALTLSPGPSLSPTALPLCRFRLHSSHQSGGCLLRGPLASVTAPPTHSPSCCQPELPKVLWLRPCVRSCKGSPQTRDPSPHVLAGCGRPSVSRIFPSLSPATRYGHPMTEQHGAACSPPSTYFIRGSHYRGTVRLANGKLW